MVKIKRFNVEPHNMLRKSEYARRQGVSHTEVNRMIKRGEIEIVRLLDGTELIHL